MQMLIKRLEIVRAAMSLADEALIAQQLPALRAALADLPANSTPQAVLALIIEALESGHYPRAMQRINAFLAAQSALVVHLDEELAVLRLELAGLERLVSAQTLERDEMQERLERFSRDFLACCGAPLQEIFALREAIARLEWQQLRRARRHAEEREGYQREADEDYLDATAEDEEIAAQVEDWEDAADERAELQELYDQYCDWLDALDAAPADGADDAEAAAYEEFAEAQRQREDFARDKAQSDEAQAAEPPVAELDADEEDRLKKAYRRACHLCHPDRVAAEFKAQAEALFKELGAAHKRKDVAAVERYLAQLQRGVFTAASEALTDREALQARIAELRASIDALNAEIAAIAADETWALLRGFADEAALQEYLDEQRALLLAELEVLQERWQALQHG